MTTKEKAAAYDAAIKKVKELAIDDYLDAIAVTDIFPELKESEDERIRKRIIHALHGDVLDMEETTKAIAWLEKQGETSPILSNSSNIGKNEQKPTWSEEDEAIYYGVIETEQYMLDVVNEKKKFDVGNISIKEECTRELIWLKSLKDRVQPQPKQEWSEEGEKMLRYAVDFISTSPHPYAGDTLRGEKGKDEIINWLKSLRPQSRWKPSDEQMNALLWIIENTPKSVDINILLNSLYEQLKAL